MAPMRPEWGRGDAWGRGWTDAALASAGWGPSWSQAQILSPWVGLTKAEMVSIELNEAVCRAQV